MFLSGNYTGNRLGALVDDIEIERVIPYEEIPHFPISTVETHRGNLVLGHLEVNRWW